MTWKFEKWAIYKTYIKINEFLPIQCGKSIAVVGRSGRGKIAQFENYGLCDLYKFEKVLGKVADFEINLTILFPQSENNNI